MLLILICHYGCQVDAFKDVQCARHVWIRNYEKHITSYHMLSWDWKTLAACLCERLIKKDPILMNGVDYSGHVMAAQVYVSLQKSIHTQAQHKAFIDTGPREIWPSSCGPGSAASAFGPFSSLFFSPTVSKQIKQLHLFTLFKYSLSEHSTKHIWDVFLTLSLMYRTLARSSWKLWYLVGSPQHQIFMSILDGN